MDDEPEWADGDPEIAALLTFAPVVRKNVRHDGWTPRHQRGFVAWLAATGNVDKAAQAVGRTQSGAWTVRNSAGAEGFAAAWDKALLHYHARRLAEAPEPALRAPPRGAARALPWAGVGQEAQARAAAETRAEQEESLQQILQKYWLKLRRERECRLEGRIVEADFYVRQLTWLEVVLDLGGKGMDLLEALKQGELSCVKIVATPISVLLDHVRRACWLEKGEADRPPPPPLGQHDDAISTGLPMEVQYSSDRDGDVKQWEGRTAEAIAIAAEAQKAWEKKAARDAKAWRRRVEGEGAGNAKSGQPNRNRRGRGRDDPEPEGRP